METAEALEKCGDARAVGPLIEALGDPDPYMGVAVAKALVAMGDRRAIPALDEALRAARGVQHGDDEDEAYDDHVWWLEHAINALRDAGGGGEP
jgi:HEAT repeat protein